MSFNFSWPKFSRQFHADAARMLDSALNRGPKPKVIADDIKVEEINMGTIPPELEILEIGELSSERLRGIFRLTYNGDAHLLLSTKVQANPLNRPESSSGLSPFEDVSSAFPSSTTSRGILFAARPLVVPMQLRLSSVRLKAIVVLVVSKQKGITLVFKNDPLESVEVSSTFDSVAVIQKYLQQEIEGQLREMFREDLPGIIHRLSQTWLSGRHHKSPASSSALVTSEKASVDNSGNALEKSSQAASQPEARRVRSSTSVPASRTAKSPARRRRTNTGASLMTPPSSPPAKSSAFSTPRAPPRFGNHSSTAGSSVKAASPSTSPSKRFNSTAAEGERSFQSAADAEMSFSSSIGSISGLSSGYVHDIENYDPTYGLRPDEIRVSAHSSNFSGLAELAQRGNRGLRDFASLSLSNDNQQASERFSSSPRSVPSRGNQELHQHSEGAPSMQNVEEEDEENRDGMEVAQGNAIRHWSELDDVSDDPSSAHSPSHLHRSNAELDLEDSELSAEEDLDAIDQSSGSEKGDDFPAFGHSSPEMGLGRSLGEESGYRSSSTFSRPKRQPLSSRMSASGSRSRSSTAGAGKSVDTEVIEYERFPAVGGGTVVRPRVYHMASRVQAPEVEEEDDLASSKALDSIAASSTIHGPASSRTFTVRPDQDAEDDERCTGGHNRSDPDLNGDDFRDYNTDESPSAAGHESLMTLDPDEMDPSSIAYRTQVYRHRYGRMYRPGYGRQSSLGSTDLSSSDASSRIPSQSPDEEAPNRQRAWTPASRASTAPTSTYPSTYSTQPSSTSLANTIDAKLSAQSRNSAHRLPALPSSNSGNAMTLDASNHFMDLVNSNHTLSPFTRTLDTKGFAVRSHPVTPTSPSVVSGPTSGSGNSRTGWVQGEGYQRRPSHPSVRSHSFSNSVAMDDRGSVSGMSSPSLGSQKAGRRRTFKLSGPSKSADNTPTQIPGTPIHPNERSPFDRPPPSAYHAPNRLQQSIPSAAAKSPDGYNWQSKATSVSGGHSNNEQLRFRRAASHNSDPPRRRRPGQNSGDLLGHPDFASFHHMGSIRE